MPKKKREGGVSTPPGRTKKTQREKKSGVRSSMRRKGSQRSQAVLSKKSISSFMGRTF
jgi:hypothetical protein